jgi:hypothetical protein
MKTYIVSSNYGLLVQQVQLYNNLYGYPSTSTLEYSGIIKNYQEDLWYIYVLPEDVENILPELKTSIRVIIPDDWCGPIYN